jgi:pimeloyl-ACP methyl ester carboxylesterase
MLKRICTLTSLVAATMLAACATGPIASTGPLTIERQGSFYVGGRQVTGAGTADLVSTAAPGNAGETFWIDQMYVQYQIPPNARKLPLVLVHGGGGTGAVWESTPDGREGFQSIFLRRGFPVYIVDAPRGGRSGFPSFNGVLGNLGTNQQVVPPGTFRPGDRYSWARWRMGPQYPEVFPQQAFPIEAFEPFMKAVRPIVADDPAVIARALDELVAKIGPAIIVTHSNGGLWGWLAGARSPNVKAIVSFEPTFVFPPGEVELGGAVRSINQPAGTTVTAQEFDKLVTMPIQVIFGDNIPQAPVAIKAADGRRLQLQDSKLFINALNRRGGRASVLHLPDMGLRGNSHFAFQDRNNVQVADQISAFLAKYGLDAR